MIMKLNEIILTSLLLLLPFYACSNSDKVLLMQFSAPWPPLIMGSNNNDSCGRGLWINVIDRIFEQIDGFKVKCTMTPWARVLQNAKKGEISGIILLGKNPDREQYLDYVDWIISSRVSVWYSSKKFPSGLEWENMNDFVGLKIGKIRGSTNGKEFEFAKSNGFPLDIIETSHELQLYKMLLAGRIDVAAIPQIIAKNRIRQNNWNELKEMNKPLAEDKLYFAFSKKKKLGDLVYKANEVIKIMKRNGEIENILYSLDNKD